MRRFLVEPGDEIVARDQKLPAGSIKELIALAKAPPGKLNYASSGSGGPNPLAMELFKFNVRMVKILADPDVAHRFASQGFEPHSSGPEALAKFMREDSERLKKVILSAGIKAE